MKQQSTLLGKLGVIRSAREVTGTNEVMCLQAPLAMP
jgi:hypothetical protein